MESSADPESSNSRASTDSTSLETLELSIGNLCVKNGKVEIDGSATTQVNRAYSSLPLNGSLTSILLGPGPNNRESMLSSSKKYSIFPSFNHMNLNGADCQPYGFSENLTEKTLNTGYGFEEPYLHHLKSKGWEDSLFSDVNLFGGLYKEEPCLPSHPEAVTTGANLSWSGFNMSNERVLVVSRICKDLVQLKDPRITQLIFEGVIENIFELMTDQHGRYLFQKLIELENEIQLQMIVEKLTNSDGDIFYTSIHRYGTYSIKKLIQVLEKSPLVTEVVKALCNKFWDLMVNPTGRHVIMECLDVVDSQKNDLLYIEAIDKCLQLATHERGCISLNNFISRIKGPRRDQLLNLICDHVVYLSQDPAGNFVVQYVLGLQKPSMIDKICFKLKGYYVKLSRQKGGSHLVEDCLKSSGMDHVVHEFLHSNQLLHVAKDRYGNYVLQTALRETMKTGSPLHGSLLVKLLSYLNSLQHGYGRNVLTLMTAQLKKA
ncbi:pumilio homolog 12-like [Herrania umbratica]|uniref:Pumilio homolog 12-like n=1 Tax=Herrania umbratica TaxID=108875 RepID=A0A6J1AU17_9ROSI|nr:pumilio homolog 12-like [Herrania umbratica]